MAMDEPAKSGVRTRKRNKSIKDSAKQVQRILQKKKALFEIFDKFSKICPHDPYFEILDENFLSAVFV